MPLQECHAAAARPVKASHRLAPTQPTVCAISKVADAVMAGLMEMCLP